MNAIEKFFIQCLLDHLNNRKTVLPETDIDINDLFQLAQAHELAGVIYFQLRTTSLDIMQFENSFSATLFYSAGRNKCFDAVKQKFTEQDIKYIPVKGISIAKLYPVPQLRTMGDIDLLIREEDKAKIHQIMLDLGYSCLSDANSRDWDYKNNTVEFEMHPLLIYPDEQVEKKEYIEFFNDYWQYVNEDGELKKEFHLLYLLVHLRKHLLNHGAGMRQFMDIVVFTKANQLDWKWLSEKLQMLSLSTFAETVYAFIERWFEIESPLDASTLDETFYFESTDRILHNGVFGFHSEDDEKALISYSMARGGALGKIKYYLRIVFPEYHLMKTMKEYSYLDEKPWLLPFAWIQRGVKVLLKGNAMEKVSSMKTNESLERVKMIEMWGMK